MTDDGGEGLVRSYYQEALTLGRFDRLADLLAEEFRRTADRLGMLTQLGIMPDIG